MRYRVVYTGAARADLLHIFDWFLEASGSIATAERLVLRIEERCTRIGDTPFGGTPRDVIVPGLRIVPFEKSAIIACRVDGDTVRIANVFYRGRGYEALLGHDER